MKQVAHFFFSLLLLTPVLLWAGSESYQNSLDGVNFIGLNNPTSNPTLSVMVPDFQNTTWMQNFRVRSVRNKVSLFIDFEPSKTFINTAFTVTVPVRIISYDQANNSTDQIVMLEVDYDPAVRASHQQQHTFELSGAYKLEVEIDVMGIHGNGNVQATPPGLAADIAKVVFIRSEVILERYYDFDYNRQLQCAELGHQYLPNSEELEIHWAPIPGAEHYELQWLFIEDYLDETTYLPAVDIPFDFSENSAAVRVSALHYRIPMIYEHGYLLYRLRGIGVGGPELDRSIFGKWSINTTCTSGVPDPITPTRANTVRHKYHHQFPHEQDEKNWQVVNSFAEEGKRKSVVSYSSGDLRARQSVTGLSTEQNALVAETIYDHQGRPAIQVLPAPVMDTVIKFYPNFNQNTAGIPYSRFDFDTDRAACRGFPDPMSDATSGASYYYSPNYHNDRHGQFMQNFAQSPNTTEFYPAHLYHIPVADSFPFIQTEWTPDNTGRVQRQAGAGPKHILGSGHETKNFYGTPFQQELDLLFGNEAGIANHYKKNMSIDPNGQISMSYQDAKGNIVATALAGNPPGNLDQLASYNPRVMQVDLLAFNEIDTVNYSLNTQYTLLVDTKSDYEFVYTLKPAQYRNPSCLPANVCFDCVYYLKLKLVDNTCGDVLYTYETRIGTLIDQLAQVGPPPNQYVFYDGEYWPVDQVDVRCNPGGIFNTSALPQLSDRFIVKGLDVGSYTVIKELAVDQEAADAYVAHFLQDPNNQCLKTLEDFIEEEWETADTTGCNLDCGQVTLDLADPNLTAGLSPEEIDALHEAQLSLCDTLDNKCDIAYQAMLADVSPRGQYGQSPAMTSDLDELWVSVYSNFSILPDFSNIPGGLSIPWRNPDGIYDYNGDGLRDSVIDVNGVRKYIATVGSVETFIANFQPEYAENLVAYHPEYCYWLRCSTVMGPSDDYDAELFQTSSFQDAAGKGYIDNAFPQNTALLDPRLILQSDPYFDNGFSGSPQGPGYSQFPYAIDRVDDYFPDPNIAENMLSLARIINLCPQNPGNCPTWTIGNDPALDNAIWVTYRALYISLKEEIDYQLRTQDAIANGCYNECIGADPFDPYLNGFRSTQNTSSSGFPWYLNTAGEYDNPAQPCNRNTYRLFKNKQRRFPSVYDAIPPGIDFYNDDPLDIINALGAAAAAQNPCDTCTQLAQLGALIDELYRNSSTSLQYPIGQINSLYPYTGNAAQQGYNFTSLMDVVNPASATNMVVETKISADGRSFVINFGPSCQVYVEYHPNLAIQSFCCVQPLDNPVYYAGASGAFFTIEANLTGGSTRILEVRMDPCAAACTEPVRCEPTEITAEFLDLFNHILDNRQLLTAGYPIPNAVISASLRSALTADNIAGRQLTWESQLNGNTITGIVRSRGSFCAIEFQVGNWVPTNQSASRFSNLQPDYTQADANGETRYFTLDVELQNVGTIPISGKIDCAVLGRCCLSGGNNSGPATGQREPGGDQPLSDRRDPPKVIDLNNPVVIKPGGGDPVDPQTAGEEDPCHDCPPVQIVGGATTAPSGDVPDPGCYGALCDPPDPIETDYVNPCVQHITDMVHYNAQTRYEEYLDSIAKAIKEEYLLTCLGAAESFTTEHYYSLHHFTLYYYDQANSLVKTVPPEGATQLTSAQMATIGNFRLGLATTKTYPDQRQWESRYLYNSLDQLIKQYIPDHGSYSGGQFFKEPTEFFYDALGRLVASQSPEQRIGHHYSYSLFDGLGRVYQVGELDNALALIQSDTRNELTWKQLVFRSPKHEITETTYDAPLNPALAGAFPNQQQDNLRGRISTTAFYETETQRDNRQYQHATAYSYDINGNVKTLIQDNEHLALKTIAYEYDLISGNVHAVRYQPGELDQFHHRYAYDADNRLTEVWTSPDSCIWDRDARYFYYPHGPLARIELGEDEVQGLDYAYTIHGWLKGMNSGYLLPFSDLGLDGMPGTTIGHQNFAFDAVGFTLGYYPGDYQPISGSNLFEISTPANSDFHQRGKSLYNGNIRHIATAIEPFMTPGDKTGYTYRYDQLNRLVKLEAHQVNSTSPAWPPSSKIPDYESSFSYDGNGNILSLKRNGIASVPDMDDFTYNYPFGNNRLGHVDDAVPAANYPINPNDPNAVADLDDQSPGNYRYDHNGNLIEDQGEGLDHIGWNVQGKVDSIHKTNGDILRFTYAADGNRVVKQFNDVKTVYIRDAGGNVLATYEVRPAIHQGQPYEKVTNTAQYLYGSKRLGEFRSDLCLSPECYQGPSSAGGGGGTPFLYVGPDKYRTRGQRRYELSNHLGNVLATISDRKLALDDGMFNGPGRIDRYKADVYTAQDYYAFGMSMPGRTMDSDDFRFGFQGQERDDEVKGEGNSVNYKFRMHDPRVGRFFGVDPLFREYAFNSGYAFSENRLLDAIELEGLETREINQPYGEGVLMIGIYNSNYVGIKKTYESGIIIAPDGIYNYESDALGFETDIGFSTGGSITLFPGATFAKQVEGGGWSLGASGDVSPVTSFGLNYVQSGDVPGWNIQYGVGLSVLPVSISFDVSETKIKPLTEEARQSAVKSLRSVKNDLNKEYYRIEELYSGEINAKKIAQDHFMWSKVEMYERNIKREEEKLRVLEENILEVNSGIQRLEMEGKSQKD